MSLIAWLDVSAEEQRRVRELVQMFSDPSTLDDLGIGQVRDAFSDTLFPGISTVQTRARYFLFVPWAYRLAAERGRLACLLAQCALKVRAVRSTGSSPHRKDRAIVPTLSGWFLIGVGT